MNIFDALAVDKRREILTLLSRNESMTSTDISKEFNISAPAISQHLSILRQAKLVAVIKNGRQRVYKIDFRGINELELWLEQLKREWEDRLNNLNDYVQSLKEKGDLK